MAPGDPMRARTELLGLLLVTLCAAPACAPGGLDPSPDGEEEEEVSDARAVIANPEIDIVIELIGGGGPAM